MKISIYSYELSQFIYPDVINGFKLGMVDDDLVVYDTKNDSKKPMQNCAFMLGSEFTTILESINMTVNIFEGDIVAYTHEWESYEPDGDGYIDKSRDVYGVVIFRNGAFRVDGQVGLLADHLHKKNFRVIGNIHQHPILAADLQLRPYPDWYVKGDEDKSSAAS